MMMKGSGCGSGSTRSFTFRFRVAWARCARVTVTYVLTQGVFAAGHMRANAAGVTEITEMGSIESLWGTLGNKGRNLTEHSDGSPNELSNCTDCSIACGK